MPAILHQTHALGLFIKQVDEPLPTTHCTTKSESAGMKASLMIPTQSRTRIDRSFTLVVLYGSCGLALLLVGQMNWFVRRVTHFQVALLLLAAVVCVCIIVLAWSLAPRTSDRWHQEASAWLDQHRTLSLVALLGVAIVGPLCTAYWLLDRFCNSADEYAYLFQAWTFAQGKLWVEAPPLDYAFVPMHTVITGNKWVSQYPPGWPLVLSVAVVLGFPVWAVNAVLGGASIGTLYTVARHVGPSTVGLAIAGYCALTPFYIFNAASYYSHVVTALAISVFLLLGLRYVETGTRWDALLIGISVGYIGLTRYYTAMLVFIPFVIWLLLKRRHVFYKTFLWMGLGGAPFLAALLLYHYAIMDDPFKPTYALEEANTFFSLDILGLRGAINLSELRIAELMQWASLLLPFVYVCCLAIKIKTKSLAFYDFVFPCFFVGFFFVAFDGGNRYGPRYYLDVYPALLLTIASAIQPIMAWVKQRSMQGFLLHVVLVSVLSAACAYPVAAHLYYRISQERQDVYHLIKEGNIHHAVVVIKAATGRAWPMKSHDLARNGLEITGDVLFARGSTNPGELYRVFPDRTVWVYERDLQRSREWLYPVPNNISLSTK